MACPRTVWTSLREQGRCDGARTGKMLCNKTQCAHPPAEPGRNAAPTPPLRSASMRMRSSTLLRMNRRSMRSGRANAPGLPRVWARPRACTSALGSQSESRMMTEVMPGKSMPKPQARADSRNRNASLHRHCKYVRCDLAPRQQGSRALICPCTWHHRGDHVPEVPHAFECVHTHVCISTWSRSGARSLPALLIEALKSLEPLDGGHAIVNPLQTTFAPLTSGPLLHDVKQRHLSKSYTSDAPNPARRMLLCLNNLMRISCQERSASTIESSALYKGVCRDMQQTRPDHPRRELLQPPQLASRTSFEAAFGAQFWSDMCQNAAIYLDEVKGLGALGEDEDALLSRAHEGHQPIHELPLGGYAHHLAVRLVLRPSVVQQIRVVAHLRAAAKPLRCCTLQGVGGPRADQQLSLEHKHVESHTYTLQCQSRCKPETARVGGLQSCTCLHHLAYSQSRTSRNTRCLTKSKLF